MSTKTTTVQPVQLGVVVDLDIGGIIPPVKVMDKTETSEYIQRLRRETGNQSIPDDAKDVRDCLFPALIVGKKNTRSKLVSAVNAARKYHRDHTLAWGDRDGRLVKNSFITEFRANISGLLEVCRQAHSEYVAAYPEMVDKVQRELGSSFKANLYPPEEKVRAAFYARVEYDQPVDVRQAFGAVADDELRSQMQEELNVRMEVITAAAKAEAWKVVLEPIQSMADRLKDPNCRVGTIINSIGKMVEKAETLPFVSDNADNRLTALVEHIKEVLAQMDSESLKNDSLRTAAQQWAEKVTGRFGELGQRKFA